MRAATPVDLKLPPTKRTGLVAWAVAGLGLSIFLVGLLDNINFTVDDVFIPLRYAENFAAGRGLVYNVGERVEGFSDLAWTVVLGYFARAGFTQHTGAYDLLRVAKLLGAGCGLLTLLVLAWAALRARNSFDMPRKSGFMSLAVLGAGGTYSMSLWSVAGLETPLAALLVTLAGLLFFLGLRIDVSQPRGRPGFLVAAGALAGLLSVVRPEQIFIWILAVVAVSLTAPVRPRGPVLGSLGVAISIYLALVVWRLGYYGALLPNSVAAKMGGGLAAALIGLKYALAGVVSSVGLLGIGFLGLPALLRRGSHWQFLVWLCAAELLFVAVSGGDWMPGFRFLVPILPMLWFVAMACLVTFMQEWRTGWHGYSAGLVVAVLCLAAFSNGRAYVRAQTTYPTGIKQISWDAFPTRVRVARELRSIVAPGDTLAIFEAGYFPYFNPDVYVLDLSGLMDPGIARLPGLHMHKLTSEYFLRRRPRWYLTMVSLGRPSGDGMTLLRSPEFRARYELARYYDGGRIGIEATREGQVPPLEADLSFALFRRRD